MLSEGFIVEKYEFFCIIITIDFILFDKMGKCNNIVGQLLDTDNINNKRLQFLQPIEKQQTKIYQYFYNSI